MDSRSTTPDTPDPGHSRRIARSTAVFSLATAVSRVLGLMREMVSAYFFGVSGLINAFTVAIQIPNLVRALVADAALSGAFVPVFSELLEKGERQRAWLALALAQQPRILLLDEPTTFLDLSHQLEVLDLIRYLNVEHGLTVVMVLHDLNQAARYAGRIVVLREGRVYGEGPPAAVLTPETLRQVFGVEGRVLPGPDGVEMVIVPVGRVP